MGLVHSIDIGSWCNGLIDLGGEGCRTGGWEGRWPALVVSMLSFLCYSLSCNASFERLRQMTS